MTENNKTKIPRAVDVAERIERQQRDLTALIDRICRLRREKFTGKMMVVFEDGKAVKFASKASEPIKDNGENSCD